MCFLKKFRSFCLTEENKNYKLFKKGDAVVYLLKKKASKATIIHLLESTDIVWEQLYPFGGKSRPSSVKKIVLKPLIEKGRRTTVLYKGKPQMIRGLDEGIFVSDISRCKEGSVLFMSKKAFPCL